MGEMEFEKRELVKAVNIAVQEMSRSTKELRLSTPGGRFHVRWDEGGSATAMGQLAFFAEFLEVSEREKFNYVPHWQIPTIASLDPVRSLFQ